MTEDKSQARIIEICSGVYRLKVPMVRSAGSVNSFILRDGNGGWTVIDPGFNVGPCYEGWQRLMSELGIGFDDIRLILCTHFHGDHTGMAGWFERQCAAPICMHPLDIECYHAEWDDDAAHFERMLAMMRSYGLTDNGRIEEMRSQRAYAGSSGIEKCSSFTPLNDGDAFPAEGGRLHTIMTPGHTAGHCMFVYPEKKLVFGGDMLLPITYPPVGLKSYGDRNPVAQMLDTLNMIKVCLPQWEGLSCLTGHGWAFSDPAGRAEAELEYFRDRIEWFYKRCAEQPVTAYELAEESAAAGNKRRLHLIISEAIAYLEYLHSQGRAKRELKDGIYYFQSK